ncbi:central glycolytic genes regulator [Caminicella sporogenes DSM 14501]|uniref:Central glycolytic genes regulator n=1 Tax=Caminicella sporogenes DSM 14501 TaxID=1121266 RepID=A0A1M6MLU5_9FIRM|nr:sugar-binding domain-containing protein [Caminicella sporogenes]SHJ84253.1 central glycolytic genes regulator [Caminicella sporogenes DSM 14501]
MAYEKRDVDNEKSSMIYILNMIKNILPDYIEIIEKRYNMLEIISLLEPIGRRNLSNKMGLSERNIRTEANILKEQGLIEITSEGMNITKKGKDTIENLKYIFKELKGLKKIESKVKEILGIKRVFVVSDTIGDKKLVLKLLGDAVSNYLNEILKDGSVIGVTGGTTMYHVIEEFKAPKQNFHNVIVIPARGGVGKEVQYQANTLVQKLSDKLGCNYKTLYTPDSLSENAIQSLKNEPSIKEIIELIPKIDVLIFGIGRADKMARRRGLGEDEVRYLLEKGAVSEAFGYYFNEQGKIVHEISTIGINLEQFKKLKHVIAVAGGEEKTEAIISISKLNKELVLVTDERVAKKIILKYKEDVKNEC